MQFQILFRVSILDLLKIEELNFLLIFREK
nr:MAG TPA: hypothetical protein [Caudoviricetes sp.]